MGERENVPNGELPLCTRPDLGAVKYSLQFKTRCKLYLLHDAGHLKSETGADLCDFKRTLFVLCKRDEKNKGVDQVFIFLLSWEEIAL